MGSLSTHDVVEGGSETWDHLREVGLVTAAERHQFVTQETLDDLLATVGYLAKQVQGAR